MVNWAGAEQRGCVSSGDEQVQGQNPLQCSGGRLSPGYRQLHPLGLLHVKDFGMGSVLF